MEDVRKYKDVRIVTDPDKMIKLTSKPSYHDFDLIDVNNMMLMYMRSYNNQTRQAYILWG